MHILFNEIYLIIPNDFRYNRRIMKYYKIK